MTGAAALALAADPRHDAVAMNVAITKVDARSDYRRRRGAFVADLSEARREMLERALAERLAPVLAVSRVIASYASSGSEIDPRFVEAGVATLAFPRVVGGDQPLAFHRCRREDLRPGWRAIAEPPAAPPLAVPDLVLVPLLAVTEAGIRLGQGGGFYDRTLAQLRGAGPGVAVGLAWEVQVARSLPHDPHDAVLDWVATPARLIDCTALRRGASAPRRGA